MNNMFSLAFIGFSLIGFGMAFYHYSQKDKLLQSNDLTEIRGIISLLDVSSFGRNATVKIQLNEYPNEFFLTDKNGYSATSRSDLISDKVVLSLKKDEEKTFDARFFYALKANQKNYLSVENYNQMLQKYHNGNFRLGLIGSVICLAVAILGLFF